MAVALTVGGGGSWSREGGGVWRRGRGRRVCDGGRVCGRGELRPRWMVVGEGWAEGRCDSSEATPGHGSPEALQ